MYSDVLILSADFSRLIREHLQHETSSSCKSSMSDTPHVHPLSRVQQNQAGNRRIEGRKCFTAVALRLHLLVTVSLTHSSDNVSSQTPQTTHHMQSTPGSAVFKVKEQHTSIPVCCASALEEHG